MMTRSELECPMCDLEIVISDFERQGSRTNWCITNADRSKFTCREVALGQRPCLIR
jgi:hypothetical protein